MREAGWIVVCCLPVPAFGLFGPGSVMNGNGRWCRLHLAVPLC